MARSYEVHLNIDDPQNAVWFQRTGVSSTNQYFPNTIYGEASFDLTVYFWHGAVSGDGTPAAGTTAANFQSGDALTLYGRIEDQPSGVAATTLAVGSFTIGQNSVLFDVNAGLVPDEWSRVNLDTTSKYPIAIWFNGTHEGDELTAKTNVIVIDKDHVGTGDALILDAADLTYTPTTPADWVVTPTTMQEGLDELADRVQTIEENPASGDMLASVYDPQAVNGDAFDRANHTGLQTASTISDFTATVDANTKVSGTVTAHSDVSDAGSGAIISTAERTNLSTAFAHVSSTANPHNVDADDVGRTTPQWYASHIQSTPIDDPSVATDQYVATWDSGTSSVKWVAPPGLGGGEANDLQLDAGATGQDIRITKTGSNVITKGLLGANNASVTTVGSDVVIDVVNAIEGTRGAIAIANTADVTTGTDDTKAVTPAKLEAKLGDYQKKSLVIKTTSGAYSLLAGDIGAVVKVDNTLTLPVLTAGYNCMVYNTLGTAVTITPSGTTIDNTTDTKIAPNGSISVIYLDTTTIIIDGNTEA